MHTQCVRWLTIADVDLVRGRAHEDVAPVVHNHALPRPREQHQELAHARHRVLHMHRGTYSVELLVMEPLHCVIICEVPNTATAREHVVILYHCPTHPQQRGATCPLDAGVESTHPKGHIIS